MLRWRLNALYKKSTERRIFLKKIIIFVVSLHAILFVMMFGVMSLQKNEHRFNISTYQSSATYVLMPLHKHVENVLPKVHDIHNMHKKSQVINYETYNHHKKLQKTTSKSLEKLKQSGLMYKTKKSTKESLQHIMQKDHASAALIERNHPIKINKKVSKKNNKNNIATKKIIKQVIQETISSHEEQLKTQDTELLKSINQNIVSEKTQKIPLENQEISLNDQSTETSIDLDNVVFIGYKQLDECVVSSKIQHSVQQNWTPPTGLDQNLECQLRVIVSPQGIATTVTIVKSSGIYVYDTSARTALLQTEYPQETWGKTIMIMLGN